LPQSYLGVAVAEEEEAGVCGRAAAAEETGGVESNGDLESFVMKSETPRGGLLFISLKLSASVLN
jgi:hypothetical protein